MKRAARPGASARLLAVLLLALPVLGGACRRVEHGEVAAGRRVALPAAADSGASVAAAPGGRAWVAAWGRLALLDTVRGAVPVLVDLESTAPARVVGSDSATVYLRTGTSLLAVDPDSARVGARLRRVGEGGFAPDPRGGGYVATRNGGVLGVAPGSLRLLWSWPERGPEGTALAVSPLGDRVYQALGGDGPRVLTRDAQTGRILAETEVGGVVRSLEAGPDGTLYALVGEGRRAVLLSLRPGPTGLEAGWERPLRALGMGGAARVAVSPAGGRLALVFPEEEGALSVLDAATGEVVAGERGVLDAAFAPDGALLLLTPRELRVVRLR